jgi:hypothetical protein
LHQNRSGEPTRHETEHECQNQDHFELPPLLPGSVIGFDAIVWAFDAGSTYGFTSEHFVIPALSSCVEVFPIFGSYGISVTSYLPR